VEWLLLNKKCVGWFTLFQPTLLVHNRMFKRKRFTKEAFREVHEKDFMMRINTSKSKICLCRDIARISNRVYKKKICIN
jgi:hypothetical protein